MGTLGIFGYVRVNLVMYWYIRYIWVYKGSIWYIWVYMGILGITGYKRVYTRVFG